MKRVIAGMLAILLLFLSPAELLAENILVSDVAIEESTAVESDVVEEGEISSEEMYGTGGLVPLQKVPLTEEEFEEAMAEDTVIEGTEDIKYAPSYLSQIYNNEWDKYSTHYFYNQLSQEEKKAWDQLYASCLEILTSPEDAPSSGSYYRTALVRTPYTDTADGDLMISLFYESHPQFYFLKPNYYSYLSSGNVYIGICLYDVFGSGDTRTVHTDIFFDNVEEVLSAITTESNDMAKVKKLQDALTDKVSYNYGALDESGNVTNEEVNMTQTTYGAFCKNTTVCAGYAESLQLLCNAVGVDAICVTSYNHKWNKIRMNDCWYNVDPTWDDTTSTGVYKYTYFARSDAYYITNSSHVELAMWDGISPDANYDTTPSSGGTVSGQVHAWSEITATPSYTTKETADGILVTISCATPDARIYYTLDGIGPSEAKTKSMRYKEPFYITDSCTLAVIAVSDGRWDSGGILNPISIDEYSINYNLNGGTNSSDNPSTYTKYEEITLANPTRVGYTFGGWYTDSSFTNPITKIAKGSTSAVTVYAKWTPIEYTIKYYLKLEGNNYSYVLNNTGNPATYTVETSTINLKAPTYKGYNVDGWYTDSSFSNKVTSIPKGTTGNIILWATGEEAVYDVTYYLNGGKMASGVTNPTTYKISDDVSLNSPTRTGYYFGGWYTDEECEDKCIDSLSSDLTGDLKLYAKWTAVSYYINYELGSTDDYYYPKNHSSNPSSYTVEDAITLKSPTKTGFTFKGWYTDAKFKNKITSIAKGTKGDITLYAKWERKTYTITYKLNGGKNSSSNPTSYHVNTEYTTFIDATRKGYTFAGWYSDSACTKEVWYIGYGRTGNLTLYAKWTPNTYDIFFYSNGGSGSMSSLYDRKYGTTYKLPANTYKRTGYTFIGWNTKADGTGTSYANKASVKNLSKERYGSVYLYAQWKKTKYTITYKLNGGKNNSKNPTSYYVTSSTITLKNPTRKGYTFDGWYSDSKYKNSEYWIWSGSAGNVTLYAKWIPHTYNIKFDDNGATSGSMKKVSNLKYGTKYTFKANGFKKKGYTFVGWNTRADGKGTSYKNKASFSNLTATNGKTVTLYAQWKKTKYTITYKLNGGKNNSKNPSSYYVTTSTITLKNPTRKGYVFKGWYKDSKYKNKVTKIKKKSTGNVTLYAKWKKK